MLKICENEHVLNRVQFTSYALYQHEVVKLKNRTIDNVRHISNGFYNQNEEEIKEIPTFFYQGEQTLSAMFSFDVHKGSWENANNIRPSTSAGDRTFVRTTTEQTVRYNATFIDRFHVTSSGTKIQN